MTVKRKIEVTDRGRRVTELRERLGHWRIGRPYTQPEFAVELSKVWGGRLVAQGQISTWEADPDDYKLAAISFVHPDDPRACFEWLLGARTTLPGIPEYPPSAPLDGLQVTPVPETSVKLPKRRRKSAND